MASQPVQAEAAPIDTGAAATTDTTTTTQNDTQPAETSTQDQLYPDDTTRDPVDPNANPDDTGDEDPDADPSVNDEDAPKPIAAPNSWPAEDKAHWDKLTPEAQAVIQRRETERDKQIYAKGQEVRQTEAQAREAVMTIQQNMMQGVQALLMGSTPPPAPDPALLRGQDEHRALFYEQDAAVRQWQTQQQQLQSYLGQVQQQAGEMETQHRTALLAQDEEVLARELGDEWSEPSKRQKFLSDLEPIGGELGYTKELMAQANATDILALHKANAWKAKAARWDALQKAKMTDVRAAKQNPPKMLQPGVAGSSQNNVPQTTQAILYPNDPPRR